MIAVVLLYGMFRQGTAAKATPSRFEVLPRREERRAASEAQAEAEMPAGAEAEVEEEAESMAREHGIYPAS